MRQRLLLRTGSIAMIHVNDAYGDIGRRFKSSAALFSPERLDNWRFGAIRSRTTCGFWSHAGAFAPAHRCALLFRISVRDKLPHRSTIAPPRRITIRSSINSGECP